VTEWPVFVDAVRALETDRSLLQSHRIQHRDNLCFVGWAHTQGAVSADMHESCVELIGFRLDAEPVFVNQSQLSDALEQLVSIESGHHQVLTTLYEIVDVHLGPERLQLACVTVLDNVETLVGRQTIVQRGGGCLQLDGAVGHDLGFSPAVLQVPVYGEHMIGEDFSEGYVF